MNEPATYFAKLDNPAISIVMAAYNYAPYVMNAVNSVLAQSFSNWELIIINDASTDSTAELLDSLTDPRIQVLHNRLNIGVDASMNRGFAVSRGKFICDLDADDRLPNDALEIMHSKLIKGHDLVMGSIERFDQQTGKSLGIVMPVDITSRQKILNFIQQGSESISLRGINCHSYMFDRSLLFKAGYRSEVGPPNACHVDYEFLMRLIKHTVSPAVVNQVVYYYSVHSKGLNKTFHDTIADYHSINESHYSSTLLES